MPACHPPAKDSLDLRQGHVLAGQKPPDKSLAAKCGPAQDRLPFPFEGLGYLAHDRVDEAERVKTDRAQALGVTRMREVSAATEQQLLTQPVGPQQPRQRSVGPSKVPGKRQGRRGSLVAAWRLVPTE